MRAQLGPSDGIAIYSDRSLSYTATPLTTKPEAFDFSKVLVQANRHVALAPVDLQTQRGYLINHKFVHLHGIPTRRSEQKTQTTTIKGSQGTIHKVCTIQSDCIAYLLECTFYVAHLSA